jgi:nucleotide-binding universal stress UspA family protein
LANPAGSSYNGQPIQALEGSVEVSLSSVAQEGDLLVTGLSKGTMPRRDEELDFCEYVALRSQSPVLFVPASWPTTVIGKHVLVGWNGSASAERSIANALPILQRAKSVQLAAIPAGLVAPEELRASEMALLSQCRQLGIATEVISCGAQADAGVALLSIALREHCDLLVMGCVAHPHWRDILLGGASRVVLQQSTLPVLMFH